MENKFYAFSTWNFLNTLAGVPRYYLERQRNGTWGNNPKERDMFDDLIFGDYPDYLESPLDFQITEGTKLRDVIETRYLNCYLISDRLKDLYTTEGLTGWKTYEVNVTNKRGKGTIEGFNGFSVIGRNPQTKGESTTVPDFFRLLPKGVGIICTQKVFDVLKKHKIKDFDLWPLDDHNHKHLFDLINF